MRNVWQISGGASNRSYVDTLLRNGVGLIGPGDAGPWRPDREDDDFEGSIVRRFASEVSLGDVFLMRSGTSRIHAVGLVASDYVYLNAFDNLNGWDLQHDRRVRWFRLPQEFDFGSPVVGANTRHFGMVSHEQVTDYAERFINSPPIDWQHSLLPPLPAEEEPLAEVPSFLQDVVAVAQDLGGHLYWDCTAFGERPTEDESVAHLVVPFFRSLGWPQEQIAIKWRYIDVALFSKLPRTPENCQFVVEAKHLGAGVEGAVEQAMGYVESPGVRRDIVVTDGVRYRLYAAEKDFAPVAYANLARLKASAAELFARLRRR
jgi:hypothetical protein